MFAFLVTLLALDALLLSVVVLLQAGQGGGLASLGGGGTETVMGSRQAVTILTKLTWWCGGIFLLLSLILSFVPRGASSSALQERIRAATPAAPQQAPLPLGQPGQPSGEAPKTGTTPGTAATPQSRQAPLPLGAPTTPPKTEGAPSKGAPAPAQPKQ
jgi:preprotein translocase subunit SecG